MAKAKKLPSGNWRVRVYDNETKKTRSFTAETKKAAELAAAEWQNGRKSKSASEKTFGQCLDEYISMKENVLSPSTIGGYKKIKRNYLTDLLDVPLDNIDSMAVQKHVNKLALNLSPKTVADTKGLITAVLNVYAPNVRIAVTLPKKQKRYKDLPKVEDVLKAVHGSEIELPCLLAMWESLRMSEIRGIKKSDIKDGILTIHQTIVTVDGEHIIKEQTKTTESTRRIKLSPYILDLIDKVDGEYITSLSGQAILKRFYRLCDKHGVKRMAFHDLRHMNASIMLALGIPDKYAMERGGWSTPNIMKSVYQHTFSDGRQKADEKIDAYFDSILQNLT